jgi:S1/P1 Nuclease
VADINGMSMPGDKMLVIFKHLLLTLLLCLAVPAAAWDNRGHRLTGELAFDRLQVADPAAVQAIIAIMAQHPDRARFDRALAGLAGEARTRKMFGLMARWPDDIRQTAWDHPEWHYALKIVHGWTRLDWYVAGDAETQWAANLATARDAARPAADRAVALCWMLHIGGDMHQPLHRGHRMDGGWLKTDRAGTIAFVRRPGSTAAMQLHELWDGAFDPTGTGGGDEDGDVARLHTVLVQRTLSQAGNGNFTQWIDESETLAGQSGYSGPALLAAATPAAAPAMTPAYMAMLRNMAATRISAAGARLGMTMAGLR